MKNITKLDLAVELRRTCRIGLTIENYRTIIETFFFVLREYLKTDSKIELRGFGTFQAFTARAHLSGLTKKWIPAHKKIRAKLRFKI